MNKTLLSAAIIVSLSAGSSFADQPSFNYLEGGYSLTNYASGGETDGFTLRGSVDITDQFYVIGKGSKTSYEIGFFEIDQTFITAGGGIKLPVQDNTSVYTQLSYAYYGSDVAGFSSSEDGFELEGGVRTMLADNTEVSANIKHTNLNRTATTVGVGLRQYFNDSFGVFAEVSRNDFKNNAYDIGVSFRF